jgi:rubrerythrin
MQLESQDDALQALVKAEEEAESAYLSALSKLEDPALVRLATEILGSEAQHAALLRILQSPGNLSVAAPVAFVVGSG